MSDTPQLLIKPVHDGEEKSVQVREALLESHVATQPTASLAENLNPSQTVSTTATSASADKPSLEALSAIRNTATDAVAEVRDQFARIATELSRAGAAVQRSAADFGRFWEDWSAGFLRNEAKKTTDPGPEDPRPVPAHWDQEPGDGSAGHRPGQLASSRLERTETVLGPPSAVVLRRTGAPVQGKESGVAVSQPQLPDSQPPLPSEVAQNRPKKAVPSKPGPAERDRATPDAVANQDPSATGKNQNFADTPNPSGSLEAAQANLLVLLEQTSAGHQRTLDQAAKLIEAQSGNANLTLMLLGISYQQIEAVHARLEQLEAQHSHSRNAQISG